MNALQILSSQPWMERLGWTLIHFLWQGLSIAVLYAAARRGAARTASANTRYLLACAALAAMMAAPLVTWELMSPSDAKPAATYRIESGSPTPSTAIATTTTATAAIAALSGSIHAAVFLPWLVIFWLSGCTVLGMRLLGGWIVAVRMRSVQVRSAPSEWQETVRELAERIGLSHPVRLLVSALVHVPTVIGWLRPVVLVPVGAFGGLPPEYLEALLLHELAHIRRHDYLVNIFQSVAEVLLFYHPAVWWVSSHIRAERELCCDDMAVSVSGDVLTYARALAQLESYRLPGFTAAVAANGGSLSERIARLLGQPRPAVRNNLGSGVLAVAILLVAAAYGLFGQTGVPPAFESVSIKRNTSNWADPTHHPMSMHQNASLMFLILFAYANHDNPMLGHSLPLPASQVVGGPAWINSVRYDIATKPVGDSDPREYWVMWQALLADRFKLRLHRETREIPIYNLTVAANGPKLPKAKDAGCISFPPGKTPRPVPGKVDCGYISGPFVDYAGVGIRGDKVHISDLIKALSMVLDRPVLDKTGFAGEFELDLSFTPDGGPGDASGIRPSAHPNRPNIFAALEQQLGLKLVPAKGPVEVLVIDHAERPVEN